MRALVILALVVGALVAMLWSRPSMPPGGEMPRLTYVATARQLGVVGYRDPAGAISPDGSRLAYSEGRFVRVVPVGGGAPQTLAAGDGQIRNLAWVTDQRLVAEETGTAVRWWEYSSASGERKPLWSGRSSHEIRTNDFRQIAWRRDGKAAAAIANGKEGQQLWQLDEDGRAASHQPAPLASSLAWTPSSEIACISSEGGRPRISLPCGAPVLRTEPDIDIIGPVAFSPDGQQIYGASPNSSGMVELWTIDRPSLRARRLTSFTRDAYGPSIAADGTTLFKVQTYRTFVADAPAEGGPTRQLTSFQSETPQWHPTRPRLSFTYGTWRRVMDDAKYPDIAQEIGALEVAGPLPASKPSEVIAQSNSEDQAMAWSPNGKWIAFHSHREMSDDVWLRPADGKIADRRITFLGRGAEVGWPRWSGDGRMVLLDGARKRDGRSVIYVIGVDQDTGQVTSDLREVGVEGFTGELTHAEWLPGGTTVAALAKEGPGKQAILTVPLAGGRPLVVHRWASEHDFSGLGVAADGRSIAFTAPAPDGYFQIFRVPVGGGMPVQVTQDPSNKSQPSWSPDGSRIAFTVWSYEAAFWTLR